MNRNIEIIKGDEYRVKIERRFHKDIFFEDVYRRANMIVYEIIKETNEYLDVSKKEAGYSIKGQRMGNNIVAFCAERGQGKTSAMQSYAPI